MKTTRLSRLLLLLLTCGPLLFCGGCHTSAVALVDPAYGFEHVVGGRSAHLETMRARIADARQLGGRLVHRLSFDVRLFNDSDQTWTVRRADWTFDVNAPNGAVSAEQLLVRIAGDGDPLLSLAPWSSTPTTVQLDIVVPSGGSLREIERFPVTVALRDGDTLLLRKRFSVGVYNQAGQALRLLGLITAGLLIVSFL